MISKEGALRGRNNEPMKPEKCEECNGTRANPRDIGILNEPYKKCNYPFHDVTYFTTDEMQEIYDIVIRAKFLQWCRDGGYNPKEGCDCYGCTLRDKAFKCLRLFKGFAEHCKETNDG